MKNILQEHYAAVQGSLGITKILSIRFSDAKTGDYQKYQDSACTILARCFRNDVATYIDREAGQICAGGNYFLGITDPDQKEIIGTYVEEEQVFKNASSCSKFLEELPAYPDIARKRYILFAPFAQENAQPDVVMLLANPAQAGRILGLGAYETLSSPSVFPALSTCASIYAPLETGRIHLNFIDYYDRYYQGRQDGKNLWNDSQMIVSMTYAMFKKIVEAIPLSAHGSFVPSLEPKKFDRI
jgi:uncharacterized protein (DUF169 family)